jgi:transposase InsO family protein
VHALRWKRPGRVWAIDHTKPPEPIEGVFKRLLVVRDLASGKQLLALPTLGEEAATVVAATTALFRWHGPPLAIKCDNGSAFVNETFETLLTEQGVMLLLSPPGTPPYNGAIEAGIGSLKVRTHYAAARHDRPGEWTCDDIETALRQGNETGRPNGANAPVPEAAWHRRQTIERTERAAFERVYHDRVLQQRQQRGILEGMPVAAREENEIRRMAISRALIDCGYLVIRRRRVTPPKTWSRLARIA